MNNNTINPGDILTSKSICDSNCIFEVEVLSRNKSFVTVKAMGNIKRVKVFTNDRGEYIYALGRYSMAPSFEARHKK